MPALPDHRRYLPRAGRTGAHVIGPGWLPSLPRPLARPRRGVLGYTSWRTRRRRRRSRSDRWPPIAHDLAVLDPAGDGLAASLPMATLRATASHARHRMLVGDLQRWLIARWAWLRPRCIPILVACAAVPTMLALVDMVKFPAGRERRADRMLRVRVDVTATATPHVAGSEPRGSDRPGLHWRPLLVRPSCLGTADHACHPGADPHEP